MLRKLTHRLPIDVFEELQEEALKHRISISDVIRDKLLWCKSYELKGGPSNPASRQMRFAQDDGPERLSSPEQAPKPNSEVDFAIFEILFLLREFLFERNGQILKKIDEKMERRFGKERKRIL